MDYIERRAGGRPRLAGLLGLSLVAVVFGYAATSGLSRDEPARTATPTQITIAALNVENFFDEHNDPYTDDQGTDPKTPREMAVLGEVVGKVNADFVGLVEVETEGVVRQFAERYLPDAGYEQVYVAHRDYGRGINNGAVSRVPIQTVTNYRFRKLTVPGSDQTWQFARDVVAFDIEPKPGVTMRIFVVHFKSKRDSTGDRQSAKWRLSEALEVRRIVDKQLASEPGALIAVIGDFNDTPDSKTLEALLAPGPDGKPVLVDAHAGLDKPQRVTYLREPYRSAIDYMLLSPSMAALVVPGSAKVMNDESLLDATDHAAVMATFRLPDAR
jgi:endonuclease/exonuclease/phosphatase family metal-dependent hydrolase